MPVQETPLGARSRTKRPLYALGAAVLALPLLMAPAAAHADTFAPGDAVDAITNGTLLPDFQDEFLSQVNSETIWNHDYALSVEIGPRVAGSPSEDAAVDYIGALLDQYGYETEVETFDARSQNYANLVPSRYTEEYASWQLRPASNGVFTGPDAAVSGEVVDLGTVSAGADLGDLKGDIAVADWVPDADERNALLADLQAAGAAAVVLVQTSGSESLPNPGSLPEELTDMVVVAGATNQGERIRTLLADGPLTLSITTEQSRADSSNIIGVKPAANGDENAPIIYIGAHIDSVVGSPGASDNGSGVSIMLELARIIGQYDLDVEVRVGGWGAEEIGIIGSRHHAESLTAEEIERTIGAWNMDMAGTSYEGAPGQEFGFWALTVDGDTVDENTVLRHADDVSNIAGYGDLQIGQVGRSDHQSFRDVGIDAAVFSWMFWAGGTNIILEPTYHQTTDTLEFVSQERMGISAEVLGGAAFRAGLNEVEINVTDETGQPAADAQVAMSCAGDEGWRDAGVTDADGIVLTHVPHTSCDFAAMAENGARDSVLDVAVEGPSEVSLALQVDTEAPVVSLSADPAAGASGWHTVAPVHVSATAADDADTVPSIEYSLDGEEWLDYTESIELQEDGTHSVQARATDDFGNVSEVVTDLYLIDTVSPTLTATADSEDRGSVTVAAADETSGVDTVEYRIVGSETWTAVEGELDDSGTIVVSLEIDDAAAEAEFRATDVAGNVSESAQVAWEAVETPVAPSPTPTPDPAPTPGTGELPTTGGELHGLAIGMIALLLAGAGGFMLQRRRAARLTDGA